MNGTDLRQRLAAILAADVAGYSRLMAADERATVAALDAARNVLKSQIESNQGRVIDMAGDSVLAVFETATGAVSAALAVQQELSVSSNAVSEDRRMRFRIGVHLGDVIEKADGTIYGDGVNIAARLEGLAEPGGIAVSDAVQGAVRGKVNATFEDLGEQQVKNIAHPVHAFRVRAEGSDAGRFAVEPELTLPDKPSLAVLPFTNPSGDAEQEYFADGVVDDIITALSRVRAFFVIARNSSFTYKGKAVDIKQVGRELGVRYVLEGSIRRAGNRVRITGQLIEAENGRHIWADRFEGNLEDIFALQDRITESVVGVVEPSLRLAEIERARHKPTSNLQAYDLCLRAMPYVSVATTKEANDEALRYLHRAIEMDSGYSSAKAWAAVAYVQRSSQNWATAAEVREGLRLAEEALANHQDDPPTLSRAGFALARLGMRYDEALHAVGRALTINPNSTQVLLGAGWVSNLVGDAVTAAAHFQRAIRLSPLDPGMLSLLTGLSSAYVQAGKYEEALSVGLRATRESPKSHACHRLVILCLVELGRLDEARTAARLLIELAPGFSVSAWARSLSYKDQAFKDRFAGALRAAGMPE